MNSEREKEVMGGMKGKEGKGAGMYVGRVRQGREGGMGWMGADEQAEHLKTL